MSKRREKGKVKGHRRERREKKFIMGQDRSKIATLWSAALHPGTINTFLKKLKTEKRTIFA